MVAMALRGQEFLSVVILYSDNDSVLKYEGCTDTSDPRHFSTGAEVSIEHFGTAYPSYTEVSH